MVRDHGVDFGRIEDVFEDPFAIDIQDFEHSTDDEARYIVIGKTSKYGLVFVSYSIVDAEYRLITARRAENWMVREYEKRRNRY